MLKERLQETSINLQKSMGFRQGMAITSAELRGEQCSDTGVIAKAQKGDMGKKGIKA